MKTTPFVLDFENVMNDIGVPITITNYTYRTYSGTDYDEEYTVIASGTSINTLGIIQPLGNKPYSTDYAYLEQGKLGINDMKMFICGSIPIKGDSRIQVNNGSVFTVLGDGMISWSETPGSPINYPVYKKVYISYATTSGGYV